MPAWEDVSPYTEQRTRAHRFSWTNLLIILNLTGFVVTGFLAKSHSGWVRQLEWSFLLLLFNNIKLNMSEIESPILSKFAVLLKRFTISGDVGYGARA